MVGVAGIAGCGGSQKRPRDADEAKEEVPPADKPTQAYRNECKDLEEYGELYVDTCSYYADQCYTQEVLEEKSELEIRLESENRTLYQGDSYEECLEKSRYLAKRYGPLPHDELQKRFQWPLANHVAFQIESPFAAIDPRNHSEKWKPIAERILVEHGFLEQGESIEGLIDGRIAGARISENGRDELIIVMMDYHYDEEVQSQITANLIKLNQGGLKLIGAENLYAFNTVTCDSRMVFAAFRLACKIGSSAHIIGVEDIKAHVVQNIGLDRLYNNPDLSSDEKKCEWLREKAKSDAIVIRRSAYIFGNLLELMKEKKKKVTALIVGAGHLRDIQAMCDAEDLNYIAIAVPAFDSLVVDHIDKVRDIFRPIAEYAGDINSICDS